jgi:hypothetical protein
MRLDFDEEKMKKIMEEVERLREKNTTETAIGDEDIGEINKKERIICWQCLKSIEDLEEKKTKNFDNLLFAYKVVY